MKPNKLKANEKWKIVAIIEHDLGSDLGDETNITIMGLKGKNIESTSSSSCSNVTQDEDTIIELIHIRHIPKHTKIDTLFDSGSQANLISEDLVKKLNIETVTYPRPYPIGWICKNENMQVTRKCILRFAINSKFLDEVQLDVVSLEISGFVLGIPYLYDRKTVFHLHENKYHLFKDGFEYIVRAHKKKRNLSLIHAREMKRIVNESENLTMLIIKYRDVLNDIFQKMHQMNKLISLMLLMLVIRCFGTLTGFL